MPYKINRKDLEQKQQEESNASGTGTNTNFAYSEYKPAVHPTLNYVDYRRLKMGEDPSRSNFVFSGGIWHSSGNGTGVPATMIVDPTTGRVQSKEYAEYAATHFEEIENLNKIYTKQLATLSPYDLQLNTYVDLPAYFLRGAASGVASMGAGIANAVYQLPGIATQTLSDSNLDATIKGSSAEDMAQAISAINKFRAQKKGLYGEEADLQNEDFVFLRTDTLTDENGKPLSEGAKAIIDAQKAFAKESYLAERRSALASDVQQGIDTWVEKGDWFWGEKDKDKHYKREKTLKEVAKFVGQVAATGYFYGGITAAARSAAVSTAGTAEFLGARGLATFIASNSNKVASSVIFGTSFVQQFADIRNLAISKGWNISDANLVAFLAGTFEGAVEVGLGVSFYRRFLTADRSFLNSLHYMVGEAAEEVLQTAGENAITELTGLTDKQFTEIAAELMVALVGGALGSAFYGAADMFGAQEYARAEARRYRDEQAMRDYNLKKAEQEKAKQAEANIAADTSKISLPTVNMENAPVNAPQGEITPEQAAEGQAVPAQEAQPQAQEQQQEQIQPKPELKEWQKHNLEILKKEFKEEYKKRVKAVSNNKATDEQIEEGWKVVEAMLAREVESNEFSNKALYAINQMTSAIEAINKSKGEQAQALQQKGLGEANAQTMLSRIYDEDVRKDFVKELNLVREDIEGTLVRNGVSVNESKVTAKFIANSLQDTFLLSKNSPMETWQAIKPKVNNVLYANINGQITIPLIDGIKKLPDTKKETSDVNYYKDLMLTISNAAKGDKDAITKASKELYGNKKMTADDFKTLAYLLERRGVLMAGAMQGDSYRGITGLGWHIGNDTDASTFSVLSLMMLQGHTFADAANIYGLEITDNDSRDMNKEYSDKMKELYPPLDEDEVADLQYILSVNKFKEVDTSLEDSSAYDELQEDISKMTSKKNKPLTKEQAEEKYNEEIYKEDNRGKIKTEGEALDAVLNRAFKFEEERAKDIAKIDNSRTPTKKISDKAKIDSKTENALTKKAKKVKQTKNDMLGEKRNFGEYELETNTIESENTKFGESEIVEDLQGNRELVQGKATTTKQQTRETKIKDKSGKDGIVINGSDILSKVFNNNMNAVDEMGKPLGKVLYKQPAKILSVKQTTTKDGKQTHSFTFEDSKGKTHNVILGTNLDTFTKLIKSTAKSRGKQTLFSKKKESNRIFSTYGMYDPETNTMTFFQPEKAGVAMHEGVHFLTSGVIFNNLKTLANNPSLAVLPGMKTVNNIVTTICDSLPGEDYTTKQETLVEAVFDYITNHTTGSDQLDEMLEELSKQVEDTIQNPTMSTYKNLSKDAKAQLSEDIARLFKPNATTDMLTDAEEIESLLYEEPKDVLYQYITHLVDKYAISGKDDYLNALKADLTYIEFNNLCKKILNDIRTQALNVAITRSQEAIANGDTVQNLEFDPYSQKTLFSAENPAMSNKGQVLTDFVNEAYNGYERAAKIIKDAGISLDEKGLKNLYKFTAKTVDKAVSTGYMRSLADLASDFSPALRAVMEKEEYERSRKTKEATRPIQEALAILKKMPFSIKVEFYKNLSTYLLNPEKLSSCEESLAAYLTTENGFTEEEKQTVLDKIFETRKEFDKAYDALRSVGVKISNIPDYWPRILLNSSSAQDRINKYFRKMHKGIFDAEINKAIKQGLITNGEVDAIFNNVNSMLRAQRDTVTDNTNSAGLTQKRVIDEITPEISDCFLDPFTAATKYFESAYRTVMMRRMFGNQVEDTSITKEGIKESIDGKTKIILEDPSQMEVVLESTASEIGIVGQILVRENAEMLLKGKKAEKGTDEEFNEFYAQKKEFDDRNAAFVDGLTGYLTRTKNGNSRAIRNTRAFINMVALSKLSAALSNLKENIITSFFYGFANTIKQNYKYFFTKEGTQFKWEDFNQSGLSELLTEGVNTGMETALQTTLKWSTFDYMDASTKTVSVNVIADSIRQSFKKDANGNYNIGKDGDDGYAMREKYLRHNARTAFTVLGEERLKGALDALNSGNLNGQQGEDAKYLIVSLFSRQQPINSLSCASKYNNIGDAGKLCFYTLRTVGIKQISAIVNYGKWLKANGGWKDWLVELLRLTVCATVFGASTEMLKDISMLRVPDVSSAALFSVPDLFMLNRYRVATFKNKGFGNMASEMLSAPLNMFTFNNGKGVKLIPVAGDYIYALISILFNMGSSKSKRTRRLVSEAEESVADAVFN